MADNPPKHAGSVAEQKVLAANLIEWFWQHGCRRQERPPDAADWDGNYEQFALPSGSWLRQLYEARDGLRAVSEAAQAPRPAVALWGMSQTGKSTSVSALIDANVKISAEQPDLDGSGGGLHWTGGLPFFFVAPHRDTEKGEVYPMHWYERSLNPFNSGLDASSCLSRFVPGSLEKKPGRVHVQDPRFPVQVHLVPSADLLHALARGFDSECLGPALKGRQEEWTPERFDRALVLFREKYRGDPPAPPSRLAYERMLAMVTTLNDLVFARVETFARLRTSDADWQSRLESLLSDPLLIGNPAIADEFAAEIFWCGSPLFTARYHAMRSLYEQLAAEWGSRPVFASLPATTLLLDMAAAVNAFKPTQGADTREGKQQRLIERLGYRVTPERILIGCSADEPKRLGASAELFCNFQALVWELVVPISVENLKPGPFQELISHTDLLDFPGVGRDEKNETNRLNADPKRLGEGKGQPATIGNFYTDVVKRGKTASIVATYSRRLGVDSFAILQNIDKDEPSNHATDQIANGIRTWLRNMAPTFTEGSGQRPPGVSLNLGLTFWGEFVDQSKPDRASNFEMRKKFYGKLGVLSDPDVTTIFALNYHWMKSPRVKFTQPFHKGAPLFERVTGEPEFQRIFRNPVSRQSVDEMAEDLARGGSGGADFLFQQLRAQVNGMGEATREARFTPVVEHLQQTLRLLLGWRHFRKPKANTDNRVEEIDAFTKRLMTAIAGKTQPVIKRASYALRELLDVDSAALALPAQGRAGLTGDYIGKLFIEWKNRQVQRYDDWIRRGATTEPDWAALGFTEREQVERILEALIACIDRATLQTIASFAQRAWDTIPGPDSHRQQHLRRYIALELTNRLVFKNKGAKRVSPVRTASAPDALGKDSPAYGAFIGPFVDGQLAEIKKDLTPVVLRPPLSGDEELEKVLTSAGH